MVSMAKQRSGSGRAGLARWRIWVQIISTAVWLDPLSLRMFGTCLPVFHCYSCPAALMACPIGVLANASAVHAIPLIALGTVVAVGAMLGGIVCGWICPFGFLQDLLGKIPTPRIALPSWLGYFRFLVLGGLVLAVPYFLGEKSEWFFCRLCPAGALEGALPRLMWPGTLKMAIVAVFLAAALFTYRPWCTMFCPLGAIYGLLNYVAFFHLQFRPDACNDCELCRKRCLYHGPGERRGSQQRCIRCADCVKCDALTIGTVFTAPDKILDSNSGKSQNDSGLPILSQEDPP
jgi:polyferredoxin